MKCPRCGGNAELSNWGSIIDIDYADYHVECENCGYHSMGSTEPNKAKEMFEKGMGMYYTNEEWLRTATTEQLAEFIKKIAMNCGYCIDGGSPISCPLGDGEFCVMGGTGYAFENAKTFVEWLKQPHHSE